MARDLTLTEDRKNGEKQYEVKFEADFASKSASLIGGQLMNPFLSHRRA